MTRFPRYALALTALVAGCEWPDGDPWEVTEPYFVPETLTFDDGSTLDVCSYTGQHWALTSEVYSVCLEGSTDAANPPIPPITFLTPACWYGSEEPLPSPNHAIDESHRVEGGGSYDVQSAGAPLCRVYEDVNTGLWVYEGAGYWKTYFLPPAGTACEEYSVDRFSFLVPQPNGTLDWTIDNAECQVLTVVYGFAAFPGGDIGVAPGVCEPGEAEFRLVDREDLGSIGSGQEATRVAALATTPVQLSETASVREIEVLDLGGHDAVHLGAPRTELAVDPTGFVGGQALGAPGTTQTFGVGQLPMSTALGVLSSVDDPADARIRMRWTCDPIPPSERTPLDIGTPFRWTPPAAFPVKHPITVGVDVPDERIWFAPQGRAVDAVSLPLRAAGTGKHFQGFLSAYGAFVNGRIVQTAAGARIEELTFRHGSGAVHTVPDQDITPL